ncbi:membrane protein [Candidatus Omnitrophus magneticus]|uniref:Membrane protein n=1 Tax=Candidatus Omnitrophus magneticus TaxID=1609969 RepID=A0A0F0CL70_9BACT|nr:membrane protein [Candidatus Omnitrophus magneticus]
MTYHRKPRTKKELEKKATAEKLEAESRKLEKEAALEKQVAMKKEAEAKAVSEKEAAAKRELEKQSAAEKVRLEAAKQLEATIKAKDRAAEKKSVFSRIIDFFRNYQMNKQLTKEEARKKIIAELNQIKRTPVDSKEFNNIDAVLSETPTTKTITVENKSVEHSNPNKFAETYIGMLAKGEVKSYESKMAELLSEMESMAENKNTQEFYNKYGGLVALEVIKYLSVTEKISINDAASRLGFTILTHATKASSVNDLLRTGYITSGSDTALKRVYNFAGLIEGTVNEKWRHAVGGYGVDWLASVSFAVPSGLAVNEPAWIAPVNAIKVRKLRKAGGDLKVVLDKVRLTPETLRLTNEGYGRLVNLIKDLARNSGRIVTNWGQRLGFSMFGGLAGLILIVSAGSSLGIPLMMSLAGVLFSNSILLLSAGAVIGSIVTLLQYSWMFNNVMKESAAQESTSQVAQTLREAVTIDYSKPGMGVSHDGAVYSHEEMNALISALFEGIGRAFGPEAMNAVKTHDGKYNLNELKKLLDSMSKVDKAWYGLAGVSIVEVNGKMVVIADAIATHSGRELGQVWISRNDLNNKISELMGQGISREAAEKLAVESLVLHETTERDVILESARMMMGAQGTSATDAKVVQWLDGKMSTIDGKAITEGMRQRIMELAHDAASSAESDFISEKIAEIKKKEIEEESDSREEAAKKGAMAEKAAAKKEEEARKEAERQKVEKEEKEKAKTETERRHEEINALISALFEGIERELAPEAMNAVKTHDGKYNLNELKKILDSMSKGDKAWGVSIVEVNGKMVVIADAIATHSGRESGQVWISRNDLNNKISELMGQGISREAAEKLALE